MLSDDLRRALEERLSIAQDHGAIGPGALGSHIDHALRLAEAIRPLPRRFLDLGSGAGLPGLVLALAWPHVTGTLLDAQRRRAQDLIEATVALGIDQRVAVVNDRAETAAWSPAHRDGYDLVVARAFGAPAVVAECGAPFLAVGGALVVSEPPAEEGGRWPAEGLAGVGLGPAEPLGPGLRFVVMRKQRASAAGEPRADGRPAKRPRWS